MRVLNAMQTDLGVNIMRPLVYGNPFIIGRHGDREAVIQKFKRYFWERINTDVEFLAQVLELQGCDLRCCCAPLPCHGDVIVAWFEAGCPLKGDPHGDLGA